MTGWLGKGIYFWVYDARRATEWATKHTGAPAVVGGIIQLGRYLNLVETEAVEDAAAAHGHLKALTERHGAVMPRNRRGANILDNRVIEYLHFLREEENQPAYDTVMGCFAEGRPIYDGPELRHQNHPQICVRNPRSITGYFLPQAEETP
ncbi:MAG: hypothetical protein EOP86_00805 [Verrucomicrobiaceae bacterium]|nr:MAG: hypothetical protein EOP86_00805 [Verrucomicrobiaceae bacterium]